MIGKTEPREASVRNDKRPASDRRRILYQGERKTRTPMESYYYNQLDKRRQSVYHALKTGLLARKTAIDVPRTDRKTLSDVAFLVRVECPAIFYAPTYRYRESPQGDTTTVLPEYLFDPKRLRAHADAMRSRVEKLVRPAANRSDEDKLLYIHDFICQNVRYDKLKKAYSHEIIGPLGQGVGVCEGIAKTVKRLCDELGVWCVVATSDNNPDRGVRYRHTWNVVRLGGQYYHLDATFDNSLGQPNAIRYDYFLLSDKQHFRDHEPAIWPVPACTDGGRFYYRTNRLSFTKPEDVSRRTAQTIRKNRPLVFHWRGGYLTNETLASLAELIETEAANADRAVRISVNRPQAVLRVEPLPPGERSAAAPVMERANEGEADDGAENPPADGAVEAIERNRPPHDNQTMENR